MFIIYDYMFDIRWEYFLIFKFMWLIDDIDVDDMIIWI